MSEGHQATYISQPSDGVPILQRVRNLLVERRPPLDTMALAEVCSVSGVRGHLAILSSLYLDRIVKQEKTIESRFSKIRLPPFRAIRSGDVILMKEAAGPLRAIAVVLDVEFVGPMEPGEALLVMKRHQHELCLDSDFVQDKQESIYATLIHLGLVIPIEPIPIKKTDRRGWVVLGKTPGPREAVVQLSLIPNPDCERGLHSYHKSTLHNSRGYPVCKYCGADVVDWDRLHCRDLNDADYTVAQLKSDSLRYDWWHRELDQHALAHAFRKGLSDLRLTAPTRLTKSVGRVYLMPDGTKRPYRDGYQTPYSGNVIYYAQHALACCCRKCMEYWHGVPYGADLDVEDLQYFTELVMVYIRARLPDLGWEGGALPSRS